MALCYGRLGPASSESAKLVEDCMCWNVLTPVRGSYPKSTDPSPMAGRQLREMGGGSLLGYRKHWPRDTWVLQRQSSSLFHANTLSG